MANESKNDTDTISVKIEANGIKIACDVPISAQLNSTCNNQYSQDATDLKGAQPTVASNLSFLEQFENPTVDLKYFNDALRNFLVLGTAGAFGSFLFENSHQNITKAAGFVLTFISFGLALANSWQLISVFFVALGVKRKPPSSVRLWVKAILVGVASIFIFYAYSSILVLGRIIAEDQLKKLNLLMP